MSISGETDPAKAAWIAKVLTDPAAARRERLQQKLAYWRARLAQHEARLAAIREQLDQARFPGRDIKPPDPAATIFELRVEYAAAWADCEAARARLQEVERELAGLAP